MFPLRKDIDECALGLDNCHEFATCMDDVGGEGSFICNCNPGYIGNGVICAGNKLVSQIS